MSLQNHFSFHPLANIFPLIEGDEFKALVEDVRAHGVREPIWLYDGQILDGRNRYRAAREAGADCPTRAFDGADPVAFVLSLNLKRRHLNESQRAMVAAKLANLGEGRPSDPTDAPLLGETAQICAVSQESAATLLNVSRRSVQSAAKVKDEAAPALAHAVESGKIAVSVAAQLADMPVAVQAEAASSPERAPHIAKQAKRASRETELSVKQAALPEKRYGVIYADPEWRFEPYSRDTGMDRAADNHYPTSDLEQIKARDVASIAADDCVLFLWATAPMLPQALEVMKAWGFAYKTNAVWAKDRIGTGYWFRNQHEHLLIGVRGDIPAPAMGTQATSLIGASVGKHSEKPAAFAEIIEVYFPSLAKIELNARMARDGWDVWGLEAPSDGLKAEAAE